MPFFLSNKIDERWTIFKNGEMISMQIRQIHLVAWGEMRDVGLPVSYFQQILWETICVVE